MKYVTSFRLVLSISSLLPAQAAYDNNDPSSGRVDSTAAPSPDPKLSADECLDTALKLVDDDSFSRAQVWLEAARDRATDERNRELADRQLARLALLGKPAPDWAATRWLLGERVQRSDHAIRGKVVLIHFFRTDDAESQHSINHAIDLTRRNADAGLTVISFAVVNGPADDELIAGIRRFLSTRNFNHTVALDANETLVSKEYRADAVPHAAIIDRDQRLRWLGNYAPEQIERKIIKLLAEKVGHKLPGPAIVMPTSRGGRDLIEERAPSLRCDIWLNTDDGGIPDLRGRPRLIRFLTDNCAYCRATAPALNRIQRDYADRGLVVIGIYHPKPTPRDVPYKEFRRAVRRLELGFPVTMDDHWKYLKKLWLDGGDRPFTSVTFLLDRKGVIRHVHPGPEFFPSDDPEKSQQNEDYLAIRQAIEKVLSE